MLDCLSVIFLYLFPAQFALLYQVCHCPVTKLKTILKHNRSRRVDELSSTAESSGLVSDEEGMDEDASQVCGWDLVAVLACSMSKG